MSGTDLLGEFEQVVLLAVLQHRDGAYALPVRRSIEDATDRSVSRGALYRTLDRMEGKGLVESEFEEPTAGRGGNPRKRYEVTAEGVAALQRSRSVVRRLSRGLEELLEGGR